MPFAGQEQEQEIEDHFLKDVKIFVYWSYNHKKKVHECIFRGAIKTIMIT